MGVVDDNNLSEDSENKNVIDFTIVKLRKLLSEYHDKGLLSAASQVEVALAAYESGLASVKWQKGLPYIKYSTKKK
jgi:predicted DNA-binding protein (UPF0278 family)